MVYIKMNNKYIYVRNHESYDKYNCVKLGKTTDLYNRHMTYKTNEIKTGNFILAFQIFNYDLSKLEVKLQNYFKLLKLYINNYDGGKEFFNSSIIDLIEPYLIKLNISYKKLLEEEILIIHNKYLIINIKKDLKKYFYNNQEKNKIKDYFKKNILLNLIKNNNNIIPFDYQQEILNNINSFYNIHSKGKLIWSCGLGKTIMAIFIIQKLFQINNNKLILIGVPSINLLNQFNQSLLLFYKKENIYINGGNIINTNEIKLFIKNKNINMKIIITTYKSAKYFNNYIFDLKIADEAHHLTGNNIIYNKFHLIQSYKTLFMTATEKIIDINNDNNILTMNDKNIFGEYIDIKNIKWAINNNKITDYNILLLSNTINDINIIINFLQLNIKNKELFLAAFMTLKAINQFENITHILIYTNKIKHCKLIIDYIIILLNSNLFINLNKNDFYYKSLDSSINKNILQNELNNFKLAKIGIISSVYIFGEGYNEPKLNAVVFAEKMNSNIRIIQSALRPNRLNNNNPLKKAFIIIPYLINVMTEYEKIFNIICQLKIEDDNIMTKIKTYNYSSSSKTNNNISNEIINNNNFELNENTNELINIQLKLFDIENYYNNIYEKEYKKLKKLFESFNFYNEEELINSNIYKTINGNNKINYEEYFIKNKYWKSWTDFLTIDTRKFIKTKYEWIKYCKEKRITNKEEYLLLLKENNNKYLLPYYLNEYYYDFTDFNNELSNINKQRKNYN